MCKCMCCHYIVYQILRDRSFKLKGGAMAFFEKIIFCQQIDGKFSSVSGNWAKKYSESTLGLKIKLVSVEKK